MGESKRRVLVVDDDQNIRALTTDILSEEYEVLEASDGLDGWEKAQAFRPDLVITDLMMPRMHGYELCMRLKGPKGIKGVKVLVVSSKPFATDKSQAKVAGADEYIVKPFAVGDLLAKVSALLAGASGAGDEARIGAPTVALPHPVMQNTGNAQPVSVRFWGTRGSCPTGGMKTVRFGGNTACTEVRVGDVPIIIDCGTGLRELGAQLMREFQGRSIEGHILVGHTHWDHIQGFPFFVPLYSAKNAFTVYSVCGAHSSLSRIFSDSMALDYFPVPLSSLACRLNFVELDGAVDLGIAKISYHHLNHPGICIGFRIETQGKVITYLSDHENFGRLGGDSDMSRRQDLEVVEFARGSDLLIREAQYTEAEYSSRKGWGHGTYEDAVKFALDTGVKRMALFHHDPDHTDDMLDASVLYCRDLIAAGGGTTDCFGARDGLKLEL